MADSRDPRALVRNAADPVQVKRGGRTEKKRAEYQLALHQQQLSTAFGRAFVADLLERGGLYEKLWVPSAEIHYLCGYHDATVDLRKRLLAADEENFYLMEREQRARAKREDQETDAAQTPSAADTGDRPT